MGAADALSRRRVEKTSDYHTSAHHLCAISTVQPVWIQELVESYESDPVALQKIAQRLMNCTTDPDYHLDQQGLLKFKGKLYVGSANNIRHDLIKALHDSAVGGHSGQRGCLQRIQALFH